MTSFIAVGVTSTFPLQSVLSRYHRPFPDIPMRSRHSCYQLSLTAEMDSLLAKTCQITYGTHSISTLVIGVIGLPSTAKMGFPDRFDCYAFASTRSRSVSLDCSKRKSSGTQKSLSVFSGEEPESWRSRQGDERAFVVPGLDHLFGSWLTDC